MLILAVFASLAGLLTVLSPCILPVLPFVFSASLAEDKGRVAGLIAGLVISFSASTLLVSQFLRSLGLPAHALRLAAVAILIFLGLVMAVPALRRRLESLLSRLTGGISPPRRSGLWGGLVAGASLGLLWAPCVGPILAAITVLTVTQRLTLTSAVLVLAYALGLGLSLSAIAFGGRAVLRRLSPLRQHLGRLQQAFGLLTLCTASLIALNLDTQVTAWATSILPDTWSARLQTVEDNDLVNHELEQLAGQGQAPPPAPAPATPAVQLEDLGPVPAFTGIAHWINSEPLTLESLRGRVVLVEFWTFGCINCVHTLPYVTSWYDRYRDQGLVVIGVHSPEFAYEHETANVEQAVERLGITYPVAQDNDFATWRAYGNRYWPALYFIDARGHLRHTHVGEGDYQRSEEVIQQLLAEARADRSG